jgi:hypothetical protein
MDVDGFLQSISVAEMRLPVPARDIVSGRAPESGDALFHMPLLALAVMVIARRTPFRTMVLGRSVALLLVERFEALNRSPYGLEISLTLRRRCADALAFLEAAGLVSVSQDGQRVVTLTPSGKSHMDRAARDSSDLGLFVRQLRISQDRARARMGDGR